WRGARRSQPPVAPASSSASSASGSGQLMPIPVPCSRLRSARLELPSPPLAWLTGSNPAESSSESCASALAHGGPSDNDEYDCELGFDFDFTSRFPSPAAP
ncbi:unnamed protein product, partial [Urochloa humidicola]